jgi:SpoVK/Ycf46/Vps4 family AAA+-type ATPase
MLSVQKTFDDIGLMLQAGYPIIYLTTPEYNRTFQWMRNISIHQGYLFHRWDVVEGCMTHKKADDTFEVVKHREGLDDHEDLLEFIYDSLNDPEIQDQKEVFLIEDLHRYYEETKVFTLLRKLGDKLKLFDKHIVLVGPFFKMPPELEKFVTVITMPLPDRNDLSKRLKRVAQESLDAELESRFIDAALGMTDMEADLAFRLAKVKVGLDKQKAAELISREKEQIIKKSGILDFYQVNEELDKSVGGLEELKTWLRQRGRAFERKAKAFGLQEPKGMLLLGVPGCGKSLTAKCVASAWKQPLLRLDVGKVFQAEVGSSENNIRMAIATAEAVAPCILWIDEIEKGLGSTSGERDGGTNARVFSTLLTWMQEKEKPVFVVATANNISQLPPELLRKGRFDEIFFVDLPTAKERSDIFKIHLNRYGQTSITAYEKLAEKSKYFNGAEIEEVVKEAMFAAYVENQDVEQINFRHLMNAIEKIVPLSHTMSEKIQKLRAWAETRARLASSSKNEEKMEERSEEEQKRVLTKREQEDNIF